MCRSSLVGVLTYPRSSWWRVSILIDGDLNSSPLPARQWCDVERANPIKQDSPLDDLIRQRRRAILGDCSDGLSCRCDTAESGILPPRWARAPSVGWL